MDINRDIIYLVACAINSKAVDKSAIKQMDFEKIYSICVMQRISACLYPALKNIPGINIKPWNISFSRNEKTMMLMDAERDNLYKYMDEKKFGECL